jgi:Ser/Thr protein kinase RdoA (MazF antagonist)
MTLKLSRSVELDAYRQAGAAARAMHSLPHDSTEIFEAAAHFQATFEKQCALAKELIARPTLDWALATATKSIGLFRGLPLVPRHRDHSPRNWLVDVRDGRLLFSPIDFERARPDLARYEFQRMWWDHFEREPERRSAFFEGYGRPLSDEEGAVVQLLVLRTSIVTVCWARQNADPAFEQTARETIEALKQRL